MKKILTFRGRYSSIVFFLFVIYAHCYSDELGHYWKNKNNISLDITTLDLISKGKDDNTEYPTQKISTFTFVINDSTQAELKKNIFIVGLNNPDSIVGCLDGLGHDVSLTVEYNNYESRDEIFFGCDDYSKGTLRKGNDYSKYWTVIVKAEFVKKLKSYINSRKENIKELK